MNWQATEGVRLRDMPAQWFAPLPAGETGALGAGCAVLAAARLADEGRTGEALAAYDAALRTPGLVPVQKCEAVCDRTLLALALGDARPPRRWTRPMSAATARPRQNCPRGWRWLRPKRRRAASGTRRLPPARPLTPRPPGIRRRAKCPCTAS